MLQQGFSCLQQYMQAAAVRRNRTADIVFRHSQRRCNISFAIWTRKAKIFSHISDLASLSCRILVNLSRAPHLVTVTNLDPRCVRTFTGWFKRECCRISLLKNYRRHEIRTSLKLHHFHAFLQAANFSGPTTRVSARASKSGITTHTTNIVVGARAEFSV